MGGGTKTLNYKIGMDIGELRRKAEEGTDSTRAFHRELDTLEKKQRQHRQTLIGLGQGMATFGAAVAAGLGLAAKAAIDWESAFTGVRKTVDGSDKEIAALEGELRQLARTLPSSHKEIAAVAEAAGQLGIKRKDIAEFTKTMIDLGETTNLTAEDAATGLAKFSNIMGTSASDVDRLGSALVALGNDGASTEKDILEMALRIAGAGKQIHLSESQVLGFASALSSVGIEAEAGGSSISRVMVDIASAVNSGGEKLETFAQVAGLSADQFSEAFREDASGAILAFIKGLGNMSARGEDVFGVLDTLQLSEIRVRDALLRASSAAGVFENSLRVGSSAWIENNALTAEAEKRYGTTASRLQVSANQVKDALIDVGAAVVPMVASVGQGFSDMVRWFQSLPGPLREVVTYAGLAAAGIALIGGAALIAGPKVLGFRENMRTMVADGGKASGALGKFGLFMSGPWGAAIGLGVTALGLFAAASGAAQRKQEDLAAAGKALAKVIAEQGGVINETVRKQAAQSLTADNILKKSRELKVEAGLMTDALLGQGNAYDVVIGQLDNLIKANTIFTATGRGGSIPTLKEEGEKAQEVKDSFIKLYNEKRGGIQTDKDVAAATKGTVDAQAEQIESSKKQAEEAKKVKDAFDQLIKTMNEMNGVTLNFREAQRSYIEAQIATAKAIDETDKKLIKSGRALDINTEAGRKNQEVLDGQASAALKMAEAAGREAEKLGGAAAGDAALRASLEATRPHLIEAAKRFGMGEKAAKEFADSVLGVPPSSQVLVTTPGSREALMELGRVRDAVRDVPPGKRIDVGVLSQQAIDSLNYLGYRTNTLPNGHVEVWADTRGAQWALDTWIARNNWRAINITTQYWGTGKIYGRDGVPIANAHGNIVSFAGGGMFGDEDHSPQIARARPGTVRVWGEPETDFESYIPWAMDRRPRAVAILRETADAFGLAVMPKSRLAASFAQGGMAGGSSSSSSLASPMHYAAAIEVAVARAIDGRRVEFGAGYARFVRMDTTASQRR